jgi:diguanylate cyclase (GGDEF)-like protein
VTHFEQPSGVPDTAEILRSIGDAAYEWRLDTDALTWSGNAAAVLGIADISDLANGASFTRRTDATGGQSRVDAIAKSGLRDGGEGVAYQVQYAFKRGIEERCWVEDTGRWFAGADGKPQRAHGTLRVIDARQARERDLIQRARFDQLTGELNRTSLMEVLSSTLDDAIRARGSCGFLLVTIDHLARLNESYGFDVTEHVIAEVARRLRARLRGKDFLGRFSGNKFGIVLTSCTPDELAVAADRLLTGVRDEAIVTPAGSAAVTVTIGGVTAPRFARTVPEILSRAQDALTTARAKRHGSFAAYQPNIERDAMRKESLRASDEIVAALNDRRIALAFEPVVDAQSRQVSFYECLMRVYRADGSIAHANEIIPVAERVGLVRMLDFRVLELVVAELAAAPALQTSVNVSPASAVDPD